MRRFPPVPRRALFACLLFGLIALWGLAFSDLAAQQKTYVDPNVNMVKGTVWPLGDPYLQRQNEPSIAVSTRNPCHLVAGANDYRTVDVPFDDTIPPNSENSLSLAGDAWLGLFKSFDCGAKWQSTLIPGFPQDTSNLAPQLKGHAAGADPTVRAGTNGLFYYSGMVFNRGDQGTSKIFVSRLIDNNNKERGDPIQFLDVAIIDTGTKGQFLDKPWMAVDVPRTGYGPGSKLGGGPTCNVAGQILPAGNVYMAWAKFTGNGGQHSKLMFAKSSDCGKTFKQHPISNNQTLSQGANIAIAPHDGTIYLTWREFASTKNSNKPVNFWIVTSSDGGESFSAPKMIGSNITTFDQLRSIGTFRSNALPAITADHQNRVYVAWSARGAALPATVPSPTNPSVLIPNPDARIMMVASNDRGKTWSAPFAIDPVKARGHQLMPSLTFAAGRIQAIWYDAREDVAGVWGPFLDDRQATTLLHTIDVRGAQATPAALPVFVAANELSHEISKYRQWNLEIKTGGVVTGHKSVEIGSNPPNLPMYANGTTPFIGDYIDVSGLPSFPVQTASGQVWQPNIGPLNIGSGVTNLSTSGFPTLASFHATWTDNRDVNISQCVAAPPGQQQQMVGQRNANVYTARLTQGLYVGSPGNTKPFGYRLNPKTQQQELIQRGFVVFAQNTTNVLKFYRFQIVAQPIGGRASFKQFDNNGPLTAVIVSVPAASTVARTLYATSTDVNAQLLVNVEEVDHSDTKVPVPQSDGTIKEDWKWDPVQNGLRGSILLNPDRTNPAILDPDVDSEVPQIATTEAHNPSMFDAQFFKRRTKSNKLDVLNARVPDPENPDPENPDPENPDPENPDPENPDPENPDPENPDPENPDPENPDPENPDPENPDPENLSLVNSTISDTDLQNATITDIQWKVHNSGNTTSAYKFRPSLPKTSGDQRYQLIVTRRSMALALGADCKPIYKSANQVLANIVNFQPKTPDPENPDPENPDPENPDPENPDPENPDPENANFFLPPDETATVTLRVFDLEPNAGEAPPKTRAEVAAKTAAQAANTGQTTVSTAVAGPDLTLFDVPAAVSPAISRPGKTATVTFTLSNRGTGPATAALIATKVYHSADQTVDAGDTLLATIVEPSPFAHCLGEALDLGCSTLSSVNVTVPTVAGTSYVIVVTDPDELVFEADELNNDVVVPIVVANYQLSFATQPTVTTQDFMMTPAPVVAITHADGQAVTVADVPTVTVALANNPTGASLSGNVSASNLVPPGAPTVPSFVTFGNLRVNNPGVGYTLAASATFANGAVSAPFSIEADLPPVVAPDNRTINEDQPLNDPAPGVLGNDSDPATKGTKPAGYAFNAIKLADPANGSVTVNADGSFAYTPASGFAGTDSFTYQARDGRPGNATTGTVTVTVTSVNDAPSFTAGANDTTPEDSGARTVAAWATSISAGPANEAGQIVDFIVTNNNNALFASQPSIAPNGTLTYTAAANANGSATVTVRIHDNGGIANGGIDTSLPQTFTITVTPVNDAPFYTKGADQTVSEDSGPRSVANWATAISAGPSNEATQTVSFIVVFNPADQALFAVQPTISPTGTLTYTPAPDAYGTVTVPIQIADDGGGQNLGPATTFNITISPVNDVPSFTGGGDQAVSQNAGAQSVTAWATSISAGAGDESAQAVDFLVSNNNNALFSSQPAIAANGTLTYTAVANANGVATVTVRIHDNGGTANGGVDTSAPQTFTISVNNGPTTFVVTNTNDSGANSLRQAIINANATPSADTITFNIPGAGVRTITPLTPLPGIVHPVVIDASTQPGFSGTPLIELNGANTGALGVGFNVFAQNVTIRGFIVNRFQHIGISLNTANNTVVGNYIGTDASGTTALGNYLGVFASVGPNLIGGTTAADRNVISGNNDNGLTIQKYTGPGVSVKGNYIGTNAAGTAAVPNARQGVYLVSVSAAQIGGDAADEGNVISGNAENGVLVFDCEAPTVCGSLIAGNRIGTNAAGTSAIPNAGSGIFINRMPNNVIRGNVISGNGQGGVAIDGANNVVSENRIANNGTIGVYVTGVFTGNRISQNSIVNNGALGIDLGAAGVDPYDSGDGDSGPNTLLNYPILQSARNVGGNTMLQATFDSTPNRAFTIELFLNDARDISGYGEGQTFLMQVPVTTDGTGIAPLNLTLPEQQVGKWITATATDSAGNTSEFSLAVQVFVNAAPTATDDAYAVDEDGVLTVDALSAFNGLQGLLFNDSDTNGDALTAVYLTNPAQGTLVPHGNGSFSYTPNAGYYGSDSFTYQATDGNLTSNLATVSLTVTPVNDAPSFIKGADQTVQMPAGAQSVPGWATSISAGPANESGQQLDFIVSNDNNGLFSAQPVVTPAGTLTFTPAPGGSGVAVVTVRVHDDGGTGGGGVDTSAPQTFSISIQPSLASLAFVGQPSTVNLGATMAPAVTVAARNPANNPVPGTSVTLMVSPGFETTSTAGGNQSGIAVDNIRNRYYVANLYPDFTVTALDSLTNDVIATIPVNIRPTGVAVDEGRNRIYTPSFWSGVLDVIDGAQLQVVASVPVGGFAGHVDVDPALGQVYVGHDTGTGDVSVVNADAPYNVVGSLAGAGSVVSVRVNRGNHRVYVLTSGGTLRIFDGSTFALIDSVSAFGAQGSIAIDPSTDRVWVTDGLYGGTNFTVRVFDGTTHQVLTSFLGPKGPNGIAIDAVRRRVFYNSYWDPAQLVEVDADTYGQLSTTTIGPVAATALAVNPANQRIYVGHNFDGQVSVFNYPLLQGTTTAVADANGIATFADLSMPYAGSGYRLRAVSATVLSPPSNSFDVNRPPVAVADEILTVDGFAMTTNPAANDIDPDVAAPEVRATYRPVSGAFGPLLGPGGVAVVTNTNRGYFTGGNGAATPGKIGVLDLSTNAVVATIPLPGNFGAAFTAVDQTEQVVFLRGGINLLALDARPTSGTFHQLLLNINLGTINSWALDAANHRLYVTNQTTGTGLIAGGRITVFDTDRASGSFLQVIAEASVPSLNGTATAIGVNTVTNKIYVAVTGNTPGLYAVDPATLAMTQIFSTSGLNNVTSIAVNDVDNMIYAVGGNALHSVDGSTNTKIAQVTLTASASAGSFDTRLLIHRGTGRVYVRLGVFPNPSNLVVVNGKPGTGPTFNTVIATIPLGRENGSATMVLDEAINRLIATSATDLRSHIIDTTTNSVVGAPLMATQLLGRVSLDPTTHRVYLTGGPGYIKVADLSTGAPVTDVHVATSVWGIAVDPLTHSVYVSETGLTTAVKRLDETGGSGSIPLTHGDGAEVYMARNSVTNKIYALNGSATVAGGSDGLPGFVHVIDGSAPYAVTNVAVGNKPFGLAIDEASNKVYVGNLSQGQSFPGGISILDGQTNAVVQANVSAIPSTNTPHLISVGRDMVVTNSGRLYFRVTAGAATQMLGTLTGTVAAPVSLGNVNVNIIRYNRVTDRVYVGTSPVAGGTNQIFVIDPATNAIVTTLNIGSPTNFVTTQSYIAMNTATNRLFISDFEDMQLHVLDATTYAVVATIPMPFGPSTVAVDDVHNRIYVGDPITRSLTIVDGATLRVARTLALPIAPTWLVVDSSLSPARIFALAADPEGAVSVIDDPGTAAPQITSVTQGANGTVVLNADGSVTYTPATGYVGADAYTYTTIDGQGGTTTSTANVTVYAPLSIQPATLPNGTVGQNYSQTLTKTGGSGSPVAWTVTGFLPGGLHLSTSGVLSGKLLQSGNFTFTINARDTGQNLLSESQTYTVIVGPPVIAPTGLNSATINVPYTQQLFAGGATGNVTWSLNTSGHPALSWLSVSNAGVLTGTPTEYGTTPSFTVTATDSSPVPQAASRTYTLSVSGPLTMANVREGIVLETQPSISFLGGNGTRGLTMTSGALPPGIVLGTGGVFTGTPMRHGTYNFTLQLNDCLNGSCSNPQSATKIVDWRVSAKDQQSFSSTGGPTLIIGGSPSRRIAQVFTVGAMGQLNAISLSGVSCPALQTTVTVDVQRLTAEGLPDGTSIATGSAQSGLNAIAISPPLPVAIGERLAFIVSVGGSLTCSVTNSAAFDGYNAGDAYVATTGAWSKLSEADVDNNGTIDGVYDFTSFRTLITPAMDVTYLPASHGGNTATLLNNGKVLIVGHSSSPHAALYDPATNTTTATGQMMMVRQNATATLLGDGTVLITGGRDESGFRNGQAETYDPATGVFTPTGVMANPREHHRAVRYLTAAGAEKVLITGGIGSGGQTLAAVEIYDPIARTFTTINNNRLARQAHAAVLLNNGKILLAGGYTSGSGPNAELFDPATNLFTTTGNLGSGSTGNMIVNNRGNLTATLLNDGRVLITGGQSGDVYNAAEIYDPLTGLFTATASMASPRYNHTATLLADGSVLITGGSAQQNLSSYTLPLATMERFIPAPGTFVSAGSMETRRGSHAAVRLPGNKVLNVGGFSQSWMTGNTAELYDPSTSPYLTPTTFATLAPNAAFATVFNGHGGTGEPFTFALVGGRLPPGLGFNAGTVAGTPTTAGIYQFAIKVTDGSGNSNVQSLSMTVGLVNTITSPYRLPDAPQGNPYSYQLSATGPNPVAWSLLPNTSTTSSNPLPAGINLSSSGLLSGTPTATNYYNFGVRAIDALGVEAIKVLSINVPGPLTITTTTMTNPELFSGLGCINTSNGTGTKTPSLVSGLLPAGVTFSTPTGNSCVSFTGQTKQTGTFTFRVRITDSSFIPQVAEQTYTINVYAADQQSFSGSTQYFFGAGTGTRLAQRVITGISGTLRGIRMSGLTCAANGTSVSVEIQGLDAAGKPSGFVHATGSGLSPLGTVYLNSGVFFNADQPFAVVFDAAASCALRPSTFDSYPGEGFISNGGGSWGPLPASLPVRYDVPLTSLVEPVEGLIPLTTHRSRHTQTVLADGRVLIAGGCCQLAAEIYDPGSNTSTGTGNMVTVRFNHTATLLPDGKVLLAGGRDNLGAYLSSAELFDPATNLFTATNPMISARESFLATPLIGGKVLITGGYGGSGFGLSNAELYDPATGSFTALPNMIRARYNHTATRLSDGRVLLTAGYGNGSGVSAELYNPSTQTFTTTGNMVIPRARHTASLLAGDKVLLTGGVGPVSEALASTEIYDPSIGPNGSFAPAAPMSTPRIDHNAVTLGDGSALISGGHSYPTCCDPKLTTAHVERYVPGTGFVGAATTIAARYAHTATLLGNDKVLMSGTASSTSSATGRTAELFDPAAPYLLVTETSGSSGAPLNFTLQPAGGSGSGYVMSGLTGSLPQGGVALDFNTGQLTGTPTQSGTFRIGIEIVDGAGRKGYQLFTLRIDPVTIATTSLPTAYQGQAYTGALSGSAASSITWTIISGSLPTGLSLNANTGAITGTPTFGCCNTSIVVKATDALGQTTIKTVSINVQAPLQIGTTSLSDWFAGSTYFGSLFAFNGSQPYTWSISGQPIGLTINPSTGQFNQNYPSDVLRQAGSFTLQAQVVDSGTTQQTATRNLTFNVYAQDQALSSGTTPDVILPSTRRFAQTFKASSPYPLSGIHAWSLSCDPNVVLTAKVYPVTGAMPDESGAPLGTGTFTSNASGYFASSFLTFASPVAMAQGASFAVVFSATGNCKVMYWSDSDYYSHGDAFLSDNLGAWASASGVAGVNRHDLPFTTLVMPPPSLRFLSSYRQGHATAQLNDGRVFLIGQEQYTEIYDPATNMLASTADMNHGRHYATATTLQSGKVLVAGGNHWDNGNWVPAATTQLFNPATGQFEFSQNMSTARKHHTATLLGNGNVLVAGGEDAIGVPLQSADLFDGNGNWLMTLNMTGARHYHTATVLNDGRVAIIGGWGGAPTTAEIYDPNTNSFSAAGSAPTTVAQHTATLLTTGPNGGRILIAGGAGNYPNLGDSYFFDPALGFANAPSLLTRRLDFTATRLPNGRIIFTGGLTNWINWTGTSSVELYDPETGAQAYLANLGTDRQSHKADLVTTPGGLKVAVSGGYGSSAMAPRTIELVDLGALDGDSGSFAAGTNLLAPRAGHLAVELNSGDVLVTGGFNSSTAAELYRPSTNNSQPTGSLAVRCDGCAWVKLNNGKVLVAGGNNGASVISTAQIFDPATGTWSAAANMPVARNNGMAIELNSGLVLVAGGDDSINELGSAVLYNHATDSWTYTVSPMTIPRLGAGITKLLDGRVLIAGGQSSGFLTNTAEIYDPATNTFGATGSMIMGRQLGEIVTLLDGRVLLPGSAGGLVVAAAEVWNPITGAFTAVNPMTTARRDHTVTRLASGQVLILGGSRIGVAAYSSAEIFDPVSNVFTRINDMGTARNSHRATLLSNGQVMISGGSDGTSSSVAVEFYTPQQ